MIVGMQIFFHKTKPYLGRYNHAFQHRYHFPNCRYTLHIILSSNRFLVLMKRNLLLFFGSANINRVFFLTKKVYIIVIFVVQEVLHIGRNIWDMTEGALVRSFDLVVYLLDFWFLFGDSKSKYMEVFLFVDSIKEESSLYITGYLES